MADDVRAIARTLLQPVLNQVPINSNDKTKGQLYTDYTGYTQKYLEEWWDVKKKPLTGVHYRRGAKLPHKLNKQL